MTSRCIGCALLGATLAATLAQTAARADDAGKTLVIKASSIVSASGDSIAGGGVVITDGKIVALGASVDIPSGATVREFAGAVISPGLIDANCAIDFETPQLGWRYAYESCSDPRHGRYGSARPATWPREHSVWSRMATFAAREHLHASADEACGPACSGVPTFSLRAPGMPADATAIGVLPFASWAEESAEVIPHLLVIDSINLLSKDFSRLAQSGVTTVYVAPDSASVIGARGAIVKTAGPLARRVVQRAAAVQAAVGRDPAARGRNNDLPPVYGPPPSPMTRRPTTRMGVDMVFRKAFYDARQAAAGKSLHGADAPPAEAVPVLNEILNGTIPIRIQARAQHDIFSALRLSAEFGLKPTLVELTEAYQAVAALKDAAAPVVFGPVFANARGWRRYSGEADDPRLSTPALLESNQLQFALTANDLRDEEGLARQAMFAVANGLSRKAALQAITRTPAEILGIQDRCGDLAVGLDADLVVWSSDPLSATSRPLLVLVNGQVAYAE